MNEGESLSSVENLTGSRVIYVSLKKISADIPLHLITKFIQAM